MRAADEIRASANPHANVIFGTSLDPALGDEVQITLIATGLARSATRVPDAQAAPPAAKPPGAEPRVQVSLRRPSPATTTNGEPAPTPVAPAPADHVDPDSVAQITAEVLDPVLDYPRRGRHPRSACSSLRLPTGDGLILLDEFLRRAGTGDREAPLAEARGA